MTGYTRVWQCPRCHEQVEGIDWPLEGDELCERCKERGAKLSRAIDAFCVAYGEGCTTAEIPQLLGLNALAAARVDPSTRPVAKNGELCDCETPGDWHRVAGDFQRRMFRERAAAEGMREALSFYGEREGWHRPESSIQRDGGAKARAALAAAQSSPSEPTPICGVICAAGRLGEPLACAWEPGHDGTHSWASLPSFAVGDDV